MSDTPGRENSTLALALEVWRRRKWLAILVFAAVFLPALTIVRSLPNVYRATAILLVDRQQVGEAFVKSAVTGEETEARLQTIKQEMLSGPVLAFFAQQFNLDGGGRVPLGDAIGLLRQDIQIDVTASDPTGGRGRGATGAFAACSRGPGP